MALNKLEKFDVMDTMPNVYQNFSFHDPNIRNHKGEHPALKGNWGQAVFGNDNPIVLELACGRGEYTVGLAQMEPHKNYIGIDIKGNRMYTGAQFALENKLANVAFFRTRIELIERFFGANEISEIWITFADPFLNHTDANKRLTSPPFLDKYRSICKKGAMIHLKTDSDLLYSYSLKVATEQQLKIIEADNDIYKNSERVGPLSIKTYYEGLNVSKSNTIKYLEFEL